MGEPVSTCDAESVISTCSGGSVISTWDDSVSTLRPVSTGNGLSGVSVVALIACLCPLMGYECVGILFCSVFDDLEHLFANCLSTDGPLARGLYFWGFSCQFQVQNLRLKLTLM